MNIYGYINADTGSIDFHTQKYGILGFVASNNMGQVNFYHESAPDPLAEQNPVLADVIGNLMQGNVLLVTDYQKLGSSMATILDTISTISLKGAVLFVINAGFRLDNSGQAQVVTAACSLVSQIERELASSRTAPVLVQDDGADQSAPPPAPRTRRSILDGQEGRIRSLLADSVSLAEIGRILGGVNRQTLKDFIISRNLAH